MKTKTTDYETILSMRCLERFWKCFPNAKEMIPLELTPAENELKSIYLNQEMLDSGRAFILNTNIISFFNQRFDSLHQDKDTFSQFCFFMKKIFTDQDENYMYQQIMEYVRAYASLRELGKGEMLSGPRSMLMEKIYQFDDELGKYFEQYDLAKEEVVANINSESFTSIFTELQEKLKTDIDAKDCYEIYIKEILIFIYTYLYVNNFDADFSIINDIEPNAIIEKIVNGQAIGNMVFHETQDNSKKRALIDLVQTTMLERKKSFQKTARKTDIRGHVYI